MIGKGIALQFKRREMFTATGVQTRRSYHRQDVRRRLPDARRTRNTSSTSPPRNGVRRGLAAIDAGLIDLIRVIVNSTLLLWQFPAGGGQRRSGLGRCRATARIGAFQQLPDDAVIYTPIGGSRATEGRRRTSDDLGARRHTQRCGDISSSAAR